MIATPTGVGCNSNDAGSVLIFWYTLADNIAAGPSTAETVCSDPMSPNMCAVAGPSTGSVSVPAATRRLA